ncbi:alanine racemase [Microbacterium sp. NPDC089189]|uniref:alanine racemase n=1 Tax=Microbacterium sp. NPDC089189 TaxID=3154972 RepID=UPI003448AAC1
MSAVLHVDLDALGRNIAVVRGRVAPAELMLVVKDDAYGHGVGPIVERATADGVEWFGAFDLATALRVRAVAGDRARIFVWMLAGPDDIRTALAADLDIGIGDADLLRDVAASAAAVGRAARVHLKVDTGLHRNGIRPEEWADAVATVAASRASGDVDLVGVWSHIAEASDAEDDESRAVYERALAEVASAGLPRPLRHLAASAASSARGDFRYDLVRVGAFCYGIRPDGGPSESALGIEPIATLDAAVVRREGEDVVVGVGALDGLPSTLGGKIQVATPGGARRMLRIDDTEAVVSGWPLAAVGQRVTIYGRGAASATDLAETIGTIGEEIAVRISPIVPRRYR